LARQHNADSEGIERRFIALLGASNHALAAHLRQAMSRLEDTALGYDATQLLNDLKVWIKPTADIAKLDQLRRQWARDFYSPPREIESASKSTQTERA
jgi:CRISPR system Cascade subunit CasB